LHNALWVNNYDLLFISDNFRDGGSWSKSVNLNANESKEATQPITIVDLLTHHSSYQTIDILKMDIEGAEFILFNDSTFLEIIRSKVFFLCNRNT
jgi:hypothetical protein